MSTSEAEQLGLGSDIGDFLTSLPQAGALSISVSLSAAQSEVKAGGRAPLRVWLELSVGPLEGLQETILQGFDATGTKALGVD